MHISRCALAVRTFSGIQPTGSLHLGNYLGAVNRWVKQVKNNEHSRDDILFCVVDQHAITLPQPPNILRENIRVMAASLLACGIDPKKCILFQQSTVSAHSELCWILGTLCTVPRLGQLTQYKEKAAKLKEIPLGLFLYPVLQAADILLYRATAVPVGEDNIQNLQIAQHLGHKFNTTFCPRSKPLFPRPEAVLSEDTSARLRSLRSPDHKMSKSDPDSLSCIYLSDTDDDIRKKIKTSVTDSIKDVYYDPVKRPGVSNLVIIQSQLTESTPEKFSEFLVDNNVNKVQLKEIVTSTLIEKITPIREEMDRLLKDPEYLDLVLTDGKERAQSLADETLDNVKRLIGFY